MNLRTVGLKLLLLGLWLLPAAAGAAGPAIGHVSQLAGNGLGSAEAPGLRTTTSIATGRSMGTQACGSAPRAATSSADTLSRWPCVSEKRESASFFAGLTPWSSFVISRRVSISVLVETTGRSSMVTAIARVCAWIEITDNKKIAMIVFIRHL